MFWSISEWKNMEKSSLQMDMISGRFMMFPIFLLEHITLKPNISLGQLSWNPLKLDDQLLGKPCHRSLVGTFCHGVSMRAKHHGTRVDGCKNFWFNQKETFFKAWRSWKGRVHGNLTWQMKLTENYPMFVETRLFSGNFQQTPKDKSNQSVFVKKRGPSCTTEHAWGYTISLNLATINIIITTQYCMGILYQPIIHVHSILNRKCSSQQPWIHRLLGVFKSLPL